MSTRKEDLGTPDLSASQAVPCITPDMSSSEVATQSTTPISEEESIYLHVGQGLSEQLHAVLPSWKYAIRNPDDPVPDREDIMHIYFMTIRGEAAEYNGIKFPRDAGYYEDELPFFYPLEKLRAEAYKAINKEDKDGYIETSEWEVAIYVTGISRDRVEHLYLSGISWPLADEQVTDRAWHLCTTLPVEQRRDDETTRCPICYEDYKKDDKFYLPCGHALCHSCASSWINQGGPGRRCSVCKFELYELKKVWDVTGEDPEAEPMSKMQVDFFDGSSCIFEQPVDIPDLDLVWDIISGAVPEQDETEKDGAEKYGTKKDGTGKAGLGTVEQIRGIVNEADVAPARAVEWIQCSSSMSAPHNTFEHQEESTTDLESDQVEVSSTEQDTDDSDDVSMTSDSSYQTEASFPGKCDGNIDAIPRKALSLEDSMSMKESDWYLELSDEGLEVSNLLKDILPSWKKALVYLAGEDPFGNFLVELGHRAKCARVECHEHVYPEENEPNDTDFTWGCYIEDLRTEAYTAVGEDHPDERIHSAEYSQAIFAAHIAATHSEQLYLRKDWAPVIPDSVVDLAYQLCQSAEIARCHDKDGTDCLICCEDYDEDERKKLYFPCGHAFCTLCTYRWIMEDENGWRCMICRTPLYKIGRIWDRLRSEYDSDGEYYEDYPMARVIMVFPTGAHITYDDCLPRALSP
ncbi:hypothetical protein K490DRAFT_59064 [Saccharata proteae CBS 121410]|uniref:RING-type domain-containing protein n=1 Tax=Saccharata proteae CBS 121410 TaxID=1314787 RepID=A0A9P4HSP6_9PEZI|nr:hypothetical protein K490DRAFT_59064 [Saccharata proteae CBS 121410]